MNTTHHLRHIFIAALLAGAALSHAQGLQITPQLREQGLSKSMQVDAQGTLNFDLQGQHWQVRNWPADLPRQLGAQQVQSLFAHHPAGPVQALRLSEPRQSAAWLELVKSGRTGRQIAQGWSVHSINHQGIQVMDAQQQLHSLKPGENMAIKGTKSAGCQNLHLLAVDVPAESAETASTVTEREPRADWYLITKPRC